MLRVAVVAASLLLLLAGALNVPRSAVAAGRADTIEPAAPSSGILTGGTIAGTVTDAAGAPIANAAVIAQGYEGCCSFFSASTGATGEYSIAVHAGTYRVGAGAPSYILEYYNGTYNYGGATPVSVADGGTAAGINFALDIGGSISGVVANGGGNPIANAYVEVDGCCDYAWAFTAADGSYTIDALAPGAYIVRASQLGFAPRYYDDTYDRDGATPVVIAGAAAVTGIDVALTPGGSVSGIITDHTGLALIGAQVTFSNDVFCCVFAQTTAGGAYTAFGLPPGAYTMQVRADNYPIQYFAATFDASAAQPISVSEGTVTTNKNVQLMLGGTISGAVTDSTGAPIAGARVGAELVGCCGSGAGALTDAGGQFTIDAITPGDYRVTASAYGFAPEYFNNVIEEDAATVITVGTGTATGAVNFSLGAAASISGTVTGTGGLPVAGAWVFASSDSCCLSNFGAITDGSGEYSITGLNPGVYRVSASATGYVLEYYNNAATSDNAAPVIATPGGNTTAIDFSLELGGTISGVVRDGAGAPIGGASVVAYGSGGFDFANSAADGAYTLRGLRGGEYTVRASAENFVDEYYTNAATGELSTPVTVVLGANTPNIDFSLDLGGSISGRIEDANGNPIVGAEVSAFTVACCGRGFDETSLDGTFMIRGLPAGSYTVGAIAGGFVGEYYNGVTDLGAATLVAVTLATLTPSINFALDSGGSISGTVRDASDNSPLAFASVLAIGDDCCLVQQAQTNASGQYTIDGLAPGTYKVRADQFEFDQQYFDHVPNEDEATLVTVVKGVDTPGINFALLPPSPDDFFSMRRIPSLPYTDAFNTQGAGLDTGEPQPCGGIGATIWYVFELPASPATPRSLTVDTVGSEFDTVLAIYTGTLSPPDGITSLGCNDGALPAASSLTFSAQPGQAYLIQLGGASAATGNTVINVYCTGDPECDDVPTPGITPTSTLTHTPTGTITPSATPTLGTAPTLTATPTPTVPPGATATVANPAATQTARAIDGATATAAAEATGTAQAASTATLTPAPTDTPTAGESATATGTPSVETATPVPTASPTLTADASATPTATASPTRTASPTALAGTPTASSTAIASTTTATATKTRTRDDDTRTPASTRTSVPASPASTVSTGGGAGAGASNPLATPPISSVLGAGRAPVTLPNTGAAPDDGRDRNVVALLAIAIAGLLGGAVLLTARRSRSG